MNTIFNIPINQLHPHARNPRTDLGDLSELSASIKANGVMQNLTVVEDGTGDSYTVIIGHRRLAAAKLAGLMELPCSISKMDEREQVRTMLIENMQRSDLTVYEQAQGFQMMLDFGDTVDTISERTGFSTTTVRRRVKLLELDKDGFKKGCERGATLMDFAELEKISDPVARGEVLKSIGTANFQNNLQSAIEDEKAKKHMDECEAILATFAEKVDTPEFEKMQYVCNYGRWNRKLPTIPDAEDKRQYFYRASTYQFDLYVSKSGENLSDEERAARELAEKLRAQTEALKNELYEIAKRHMTLRADFVKSVNAKTVDQHFGIISRCLIQFCFGTEIHYRSNVYAEEMLADLYEVKWDEEEDTKVLAEVTEMATVSPKRAILHVVYVYGEAMRGSFYESKWDSEKRRTTYSYRYDAASMMLYNLLEELGYEMSDEEKQMADGTHEVFTRAKALAEE